MSLAEETYCVICGGPVDKSLGKMPGQHATNCRGDGCPGCRWDPGSPVVDELVPRSRGGDPLDRNNTRLAHRSCNRIKSDQTIEQARVMIENRHKTITDHTPVPARPTPSTYTTLVDW